MSTIQFSQPLPCGPHAVGHGPVASASSEIVARNTNSQTPNQKHWIRTSRDGNQPSVFQPILQMILELTKV